MREAATDLDFETAARLRDEIKRLKEMELLYADDALSSISPLAGGPQDGRDPWLAPGQSDRTEGGASRGGGKESALFRKNSLDEMTVGRTEVPLGGRTPAKPR